MGPVTRRQFLAASAASVTVAACTQPSERRSGGGGAIRPAVRPATQVLVLDVGGAGRFGAYLEELLGVEGVLGVRRVDPLGAAPTELDGVPAAVVYGGDPPPAWLDALDGFVAAGGSVAAVEPGPALLTRLGVADVGGLAPAEVRFAELPDQPGLMMKTHGRRWRVPAGVISATFGDGAAGSAPAVITIRRGAGAVTCWAFDLPRNIALIRQGNPEWVNRDRDDTPLIRFVDLMLGWVRPDLMDRPDADLLMRGFVDRLVQGGSPGSGPLLALDYFPGDAPSILVATGDAHGVGADVLDQVLRRVEAGGGRTTVYYEPPTTPGWRRFARRARWAAAGLPGVGSTFHSGFAPPSPRLVEAIRARGHEFSPHPTAHPDLEGGLETAFEAWAQDGYGTHHGTTRTHAILWRDWVANPRAQRRFGVRMNLDVYHVGSVMRKSDGTWSHGHLIGSGFPARFVDTSGEVIDCYQQPTQVLDEQFLGIVGGPEGLSGVDSAAVADEQLSRAVGGTPAALGWVFHIDSFVPVVRRAHEAAPFVDGVLAAAKRHGVPVWPAGRWLSFVDGRRATAVESRRWHAESLRLSAVIEVTTEHPGVGVMLPTAIAGAVLDSVTIAGSPARLDQPTRGGRAWVRCVVAPGTAELVAQYRPA